MLLTIIALSVCWVAPTQNVDGSALTDLAGYTIYYGVQSQNYTETIIGIDGAALCHEWEPSPGVYYVAVTASDSDGNESIYSNQVVKIQEGDNLEPNPPVAVADDLIVYTMVKQEDRFLLLPIGTVPAGTSCDPDQSVNGYNVVPNSAVVWTSPTGPRPIVVVARCVE